MRIILMWTMHDLPIYGIVVGLVIKDYRGCPCCGTNTMSRRSCALHKNVYCSQHRRWLPMDHPFQHNANTFDGEHKQKNPPTKMLVDDIYTTPMVRATWLERGGKPTSFDPTKTFGVKRLSILFQLEYWKVI